MKAARALCSRERIAIIDSNGLPKSSTSETPQTFEEFTHAYLERRSPEWSNAKHASQWINTLTTYAFPIIGSVSIADITTQHLKAILDPIWLDKTETASRVRQRIEAILDAAITEEMCQSNPARWRGHLSNLYPNPSKVSPVRHQPAMPYSDVPAFIRRLQARDSVSARGLEFLILSACRQSEVRLMTWCEINLEARLWTIPAHRMKARREHRVPLTERMVEILNGVDSSLDFVFAINSKPLSSNAFRALMKRMAVDQYVPHGFRSSFRDWAAEVSTGHSSDTIELALAHSIANKTEAAYRRGDQIQKRLSLLCSWQSYLTT
ncbi:site-specific integrase [Litorivicinus sp.]|nr:site-specific integrase [Litorivicinus sp.]